MNTKPTVFIVDDEDRVRKAVSRLVESAGLPVQTFATAEAFVEEYDAAWPGCLVLDVRMPGMSGLDLQTLLADGKQIPIPIIFITGHGDVPMSVRAMRRGAIDFLQKPFSDHVLLAAIHNALDKDAVLRREAHRRKQALDRVERLTPREREVLGHVILGKANKVIAFDLGTSEKTIKIHRGRVMHKMQATSVPELVALAQAAGIRAAEAALDS